MLTRFLELPSFLSLSRKGNSEKQLATLHNVLEAVNLLAYFFNNMNTNCNVDRIDILDK